ncbi:hypothetical protein [Streptomyces collinus]|uniref:hypothetical protein n=1 Tax=Streptomyces collinus TaxID=42684 RepID=UPI00294306E3|nr:hypothetical protein [Streptomyces collinus]
MAQLSAGKKLDRAFEELGKKNTLSFELDLDTDVTSLKALDAQSDPAPGEEMPDEAAKLISGARIRVTVQSRKPIDESGEKDLVGMAMKISNPDGGLAEYRVIGDYAYMRADMTTIGKMTGAPVPAASDLPPEAGAIKTLIAGKWVKFSTKEMEKATGSSRKDSPAPAPSLDAKTQKKLVAALREVIAREVRFKTVDGSDGTEHVTATAPFRTLITKLFGRIRPLVVKDLPPGMELPTDKDLKDAPATDVKADFTLKHGELNKVHVDLAELAEDTKVKKLGLTLRVGHGTRPTAPAGAAELNVAELMQGFFAGPAASDADALDYQGLPQG